ncbi:peptidoglycan-binding LysM domain-containing protein [Tasmannia lanceolata]|uniref:peptidoglycan-binding LysM domain-containing protein n=1 Tax=Tasmannia lanceolata TaxID=3420 RepID=UPI0040634254
MQIQRSRCNGDSHIFSYDSVEGGVRERSNDPTISSSCIVMPEISSNYIEHRVSKMDTLAGVAIKYGVEVADIKRMNGLVTDLQMFAHKSLQIPLPGRHPPSPIQSNGSPAPGESSIKPTITRRPHVDLLESFESLKLKSSQQRISPAMCSLQGFYGLTPQKNKGAAEGTEMAVYKTGGALYLEDADMPPSRHHKTRSLVNGFLQENGDLSEDCHTPELLLKEDSGNTFSGLTGKGLALRPKSSSRTALVMDTDSGRLNPIPMGDSISDSLASVRKSSSTSNLLDPESGPSIWPTSRWTTKLDPTITRPIYDGLPKPITGRRNKAALD